VKLKQRKHVWLGERVELGQVKAERVDRDARILHGVKVLGLSSKNGRRYTPAAIAGAVGLYEGVSVRRNHPKKATDSRDVDDVFGWLENVQVRPDGLYADLHWLIDDELSGKLCEAADRKPDLFGLSHNADGATEVKGGEVVVLEITEVRSVDLVADPATVDGLFEGVTVAKKIKLKAFMEAHSKKLAAPKRKLIAKLFEDDYGDDVMMEEPPAEGAAPDHEEMLTKGFEAALHALVSQVLGGDMDEADATKKFRELCKTHGKLTGGDELEEDDGEEDKGEGEKDRFDDKDTLHDDKIEEGCDEEDMKESRNLKKRVKQLEAREKVRELCESSGVTPSKPLINALVHLSADDRAELIAEQKGRATSDRTRRPRTQSVTEGKGATDPDSITDGKSFAEALRKGGLLN
jgi:hypothetical protein